MANKVAIAVLAALCCSLSYGAELPLWQIDEQRSSLEFVAEQAGAKFRGRIARFDAQVRFDSDRLAESRAEVAIDMRTATTYESERDGIMQGAGWFETAAFPHARFEAAQFVRTGNGFTARGQLVVRGVAHPVAFDFTVEAAGEAQRLEGRALLDRVALGLGLGEWADPAWIGTDVAVEVVLMTAPAASIATEPDAGVP
ncbi:MAG: YceI family protein [Gammaproteobacteria bacterium]|nr:YceI family protein [Gammaproteobacteria bacterium]